MDSPHIPFSHLHTHSPEGSLLDGFMRIEKAIALAKEWGMDALGISDHGTMAAHEKFYNACKKEGLHPVLGMEAYITVDKRFRKADFESVDFILDENERYIFSFLSEKEQKDSETDWIPVDSLKPNKLMVEVMGLCRETFLNDLLQASFLPGQEFPKAKAAVTRMQNAYKLEQEQAGRQLCIQADATRREFFSWFPRMGHLLLIAKNNEGYQNLLQLNSIGQLQGFYAKPRVDFEDIKKFGKGIVCSTACLGSITSQLILRGRLEEAKQEIQRLVEAFDEVYLEIQPSRQPEQWIVNKQLIAWSEELKLPLLATSDVHMVSKEERHIHEALTNIGKGGNKEKSEDDQDISVYESAYFMHPQEMLDNGIPAIAIQNAYDLSHRCQVDFLEQTDTKFPAYEVPIGHNFDSYLAKLAREGLFSIFMNKDYIKDYSGYQQRLEYELSIIAKKGLSAYFVIVWDYVNWARAQGIFVGPGRGSGAGALTLYALGITNVNPLKYDLLFERMLNPERDSLPDIDEDFDFLRRSEVIEYITQKYGSDHVAQIGTYTTLSSKIVLKDVGRILGIDHTYINDLNKELPSHNGKVMDLADAVEEIPSFQKASELHPELFELALDLQSMPRGAGVHPCFDEDTLITTDEGLKRIVDVKVGDKVLTHERRFMPVMETMVNRSDDIYHVRTSSNHPVRVTGNHPFLVKEMTYKRLRKYKDGVDTKFKTFSEPKWKSVSDMAVGVDYIGVPTNNESVVPNYSEFNLPFGKEEFWWIVGRYIGDGWTERYDRTTPAGYPHVEKRVIICCTKNHDDEKDLIVSYLEALGFDYRCEKARTTYKIFIKQEGLFDYLQFYGKYAHGKSIYQDVFDLPAPLGQHFLEGYISADGSYLEREDKRCIRTVSKELAIGVMQLVNKFFQRPTGLQFSQPKTEIIEGRTVNSKKKYTISFTQTQRKLSRSFYEDGYIWTRLEKLIKEEDSRPMYNLTVLDDSSYVANGMAVHNCGVEVSPVPLSSNLPLMRSREGTAVTQYEGPVLENIGYVKFDILGLKNLSVLRIACELIKARHSIDLDINNLEPDDADVFEMIRKGNTMGIFQLESKVALLAA